MATVDATRSRGVRGLAVRANPAFVAGAILVPLGALTAVLLAGDVRLLNYVHVMTGGLWTGIDVFMGLIVGPVVGGMDAQGRAHFFERFTPKMTFLMPVLSLTTIVAGITLARRLGYFPNADPWLALMTAGIMLPSIVLIGRAFDRLRDPRTLAILAVVAVGSGAWFAATAGSLLPASPLIVVALLIVTLLSVIGFGILLPGEIRIYQEVVSAEPDVDTIGRIGLRNAKLGGIQGVLQLSIILVMALLRFGV